MRLCNLSKLTISFLITKRLLFIKYDFKKKKTNSNRSPFRLKIYIQKKKTGQRIFKDKNPTLIGRKRKFFMHKIVQKKKKGRKRVA